MGSMFRNLGDSQRFRKGVSGSYRLGEGATKDRGDGMAPSWRDGDPLGLMGYKEPEGRNPY